MRARAKVLITLIVLLAAPVAARAASLHSVAIFDSSLTNAAAVINTAPAGTEYGLVTRVAGTPTVQPGNTANTTPWLVKPHDGSNPLFASAVALADSTSNPTVGGVAAFLMCFNSSTWDRCKGGFTVTENGSIAVGSSNVSLVVNAPYLFDGNALVRANPSPFSKLSTADTNSNNVKGSRGVVIGATATNTNAAARYLKFYNKATAPTCGTDTPVLRFLIPPSNGGHSPNLFAIPMPFPLGIGYCITTGATDADTGAVAANEVILDLSYQ
jgi:hypothetical protein